MSGHQNDSDTITPHTVTTVFSSATEPKTTDTNPSTKESAELGQSTSEIPAESINTNLPGIEKTDKKKKRASFFSKLKAKLIYKEKETS